MNATSRRWVVSLLVLAVVTAPVVAVAVAIWFAYTIVEVIFFAVPVTFLGFLCWQALQYQVVRIGDDVSEWDVPTGPAQAAPPERRDGESTTGDHTAELSADGDGRVESS